MTRSGPYFGESSRPFGYHFRTYSADGQSLPAAPPKIDSQIHLMHRKDEITLASGRFSRRDILRHLGGAGLLSLLGPRDPFSPWASAQDKKKPAAKQAAPVAAPAQSPDEQFFDELE